MRVLVVGGGIMGQVTAWRLALHDHDVTVVEAIAAGHVGSASGDRSRIVRALYDEASFAESGYVSLELWRAWSNELGAKLLEPNGVLYFVRQEQDDASIAWRAWVERGIANVRRLGGVVEEIAPAALRARWPAIDAAGLRAAVFEPGGGFGRPALACRTIARASLATGRVRHVAARALAIDASRAGVRALETTQGRIETDAIVVAAGFEGAALVAPFTGALRLERLPHWVSYWDVPYPEAADLCVDRLPCWADLGAKVYGFPDDGESGFKTAWHEPRRTHAGEDRPPTPDELEELRAAVAVRFPALRRAACRLVVACAYDATPDEMFLVGPVAAAPGLFFVGGMSGHGFKHAPAIGESVARLVTGEPPLVDLSRYALASAS